MDQCDYHERNITDPPFEKYFVCESCLELLKKHEEIKLMIKKTDDLIREIETTYQNCQ